MPPGSPGRALCSVLGRQQDSQVATTPLGWNRRRVAARIHENSGRRAGGLTNRIGQCFQVVRCRARRFGDFKPDDVPAARGGQASGVPRAQVVTVWLGVRGEGAEDCRRLRIDVRERGDGGLATCGSRAAAQRHEQPPK